MSYKLEQPYTEEQRVNFIVEYNHNKGLNIDIDENGNLFALEAYEKLVDGEVIDNTAEYEAEKAKAERERINMLSLTAADVERAIYKAKGMDFEDVINLVSDQEHSDQVTKIDLKALKIELKANNFYRGNPWIEQVGALLGISSQMLDKFFETGDYKELLGEQNA